MTNPNDLSNADEYARLYWRRHHLSGEGVETTHHFPCPFCAAAEWLAVRLIDFAASTDPVKCTNCGRSARFEFSDEDGTAQMELVQVGGDDPPSWLQPAPRRVVR